MYNVLEYSNDKNEFGYRANNQRGDWIGIKKFWVTHSTESEFRLKYVVTVCEGGEKERYVFDEKCDRDKKFDELCEKLKKGQNYAT